MIPGTNLSRCRCGAAFAKQRPTDKHLCPTCTAAWKVRRAAESTYPKCRCGSTLGVQRTMEGREKCARCEDLELKQRRQNALDRLADRLLEGGR